MTSYTFNSKSQKLTRFRLVRLYTLTALMILGIFICLELATRNYSAVTGSSLDSSIPSLIASMPEMEIAGREIGNQMLVHNVALFSQHPDPTSVTTGYVGTSRSKVLRPEHFGLAASVVGAGNSYNEITYGLLLQAEILRLKFPNLKRVFFETSMLLRRPGRLIIEEDHRKYLPLLRSLSPLCINQSIVPGCNSVFAALNAPADTAAPEFRSELATKRSEIRFTGMLKTDNGSMPVLDDPLFSSLNVSGERKNLSTALTAKADQIKEITNDNVKVQRLRDIASNAPWDGLFDLIALWGRQNNIEVVFFQPPVRSDLYAFQLQYGLGKHVADLERVSTMYAVPFIDLNRPELGYMKDWALFSDEDHLETCIGSGLLTLALDEGYKIYRQEHVIIPSVERQTLEKQQQNRFAICQ